MKKKEKKNKLHTSSAREGGIPEAPERAPRTLYHNFEKNEEKSEQNKPKSIKTKKKVIN